jgi:tetratricopeptide (TPR) repeat protein
MIIPRSVLIFGLVFLAGPALAATRPAPAKPAPVPVAISADDLMRQADAAQAKGDKDLAFRLAQAAIVADPAKPATYDLLADLYAGEGDGDYARFYYNEALGIDPGDASATKGTAELDRGKAQQAAEAAAPVK